jgi:hypothetical protein
VDVDVNVVVNVDALKGSLFAFSEFVHVHVHLHVHVGGSTHVA